MNIQLHEITVRDLIEDYADKGDEGVVGYGGRLDIRPAYQREFIYKDKQREAVVDSVMHGFPLNVMYWAKRGDGTFEVMDGQQRTISLCQYAAGDFSYDMRFFGNLTDAERKRFLDYPLMVYVCEGTDEEKLRWFQTINIAGEKLTDQELRNAVYAGPWTSDAKVPFVAVQHVLPDSAFLLNVAVRDELRDALLKCLRVLWHLGELVVEQPPRDLLHRRPRHGECRLRPVYDLLEVEPERVRVWVVLVDRHVEARVCAVAYPSERRLKVVLADW